MKLHPRLSKTGVELVKQFEGLRRKAGRLADGRWTIGYGHTASAREGASVTADEAAALLLYDLDRTARALDALIFTPLNVNQFNALVAFAFNIGVDNFRNSDVLIRINEGALLQAAAAIEQWRRAEFAGDTIVVDGLVRRRAAEKALFLTPPEGFRPVPTPVVRPKFDPALADLAPLQPGLGGAVELHAVLGGETATAGLQPEPPPFELSATQAAARRVSDRLSNLFPEPAPVQAEPEPEPQPQPEAAPEPEPEPAAEPELEPEPAPEPPVEEPPPFVLEPAPETAPEAPAEAEPEAEAPYEAEEEPPPSLFSAPPPRLYRSRPRWTETSLDDEDEASSPFGRRYPTLAQRAAAAQPAPAGGLPSRSLAVLALGVFGAALFCGALATMVFGRATLVNLALGLLGVVCMAPSGLQLLTQLFAERGEENDDRG